MARVKTPKPLADYPNAHYSKLWAHVSRTGKDTLLPMTRTQAMSLRSDLYAWKRAALANAFEARKLGVQLDALNEVSLRVTDEGLTLYHKEMTFGAKVIENVLAEEGVLITPEPPPAGLAPVDTRKMTAEELTDLFKAQRPTEGG